MRETPIAWPCSCRCLFPDLNYLQLHQMVQLWHILCFPELTLDLTPDFPEGALGFSQLLKPNLTCGSVQLIFWDPATMTVLATQLSKIWTIYYLRIHTGGKHKANQGEITPKKIRLMVICWGVGWKIWLRKNTHRELQVTAVFHFLTQVMQVSFCHYSLNSPYMFYTTFCVYYTCYISA